MAQGGQPIFILPEGTNRSVGRDAQRNNILAGKVLAETVRTTLGPKGMDKMLVDGLGDIVVTNDGVTILKEMDIEHPAAKMLVEVAKTQEDEVGDGTTTAVIIAGELLKKSESLLDQDIHPTIIAMGYRQAAEKAQEILDDIAIDSVDEDIYVYHNNTKFVDGKILTDGGRVLSVTGFGNTYDEIREKVYKNIEKIIFETKQFRKDIGKM